MNFLEVQNQIFTKRFVALFLTNLAVFLIFYGLITTLPLYVTGNLGRTDDDAGLLVTAFLISAILVRPFSAKMLDIYGKKKMLVLSIVIYLLCTILYIFIKPFAILLVLRFLQGIWFSIATTATGSLAADIIPNNRKGAGLGYFTMSTNLAVVIGPFVGLFIVQKASFEALFIVLSVIGLLGSIIGLTINTSDIARPEVKPKLSFSFDDLFERKALPVALLASLLALSYSSVLSFISIYAEQQGMLNVASYFYVVFAAAMLIIRPFTGKIYDQKEPKYVVIPSFILFTIGLFMLAYMDNSWQFLVAAVFVGSGYGTLTTSMQSQAVQSTSVARSGYATATYFTLFDTGIAIGSYILGIIAMSFSYQMVYVLCGTLLVVNMILYIFLFRKTSAS
ncbi:MFS transporter [Lysinibacillus odysseyi]|uniref:MFS transporter n=1 Tax=Lysinibacillus odysseyi 34hs-1 = NBRC 100172 TaxID=1220589 RepID=A0A0A3IAF7_9BACI|nr:MFS transporter [Lysinibacillus odysseyi]KGR81719.1 MFS transporter [Lysinibacillus odysseyi 34hs-1 = NBRC 100172]